MRGAQGSSPLPGQWALLHTHRQKVSQLLTLVSNGEATIALFSNSSDFTLLTATDGNPCRLIGSHTKAYIMQPELGDLATAAPNTTVCPNERETALAVHACETVD